MAILQILKVVIFCSRINVFNSFLSSSLFPSLPFSSPSLCDKGVQTQNLSDRVLLFDQDWPQTAILLSPIEQGPHVYTTTPSLLVEMGSSDLILPRS
jgi:hypothetical protein